MRAQQRQALLGLALVSGLIVLLTAIGAAIMTRRIVRPITAITRRARTAALEELPAAVDEIGAMSQDPRAPQVPEFST